MQRFKNFLKRNKRVIVMASSGGLGEFLFQLDLIKRFDGEGITTLLLIKKKYSLFAQFAQLAGFKHAEFVDISAKGLFYIMYKLLVSSFKNKIIFINPFNFSSLGPVTRCFFLYINLLRGEIILTKKEKNFSFFGAEVLPYVSGEAIWQRNIRIVRYVINHEPLLRLFPVLFNLKNKVPSVRYVHIHPVGSVLTKSLPVKKLITLFESRKDVQWFFTITPAEERWYVTKELRSYLDKNEHVTYCCKNFHASEIASIIRHSLLVVTVNTGVLWMSIMLNQKTLVVDTFTDEEWNPKSYPNITRLCREEDEEGRKLHLTLAKYEDGTFYESMYLITTEEILQALRTFVHKC